MKKLLFICNLLIITLAAHATIRRVGFTELPQVAGVDYVTFFQAYQAAASGDTIYVHPSSRLSGDGWTSIAGGNYEMRIAKKLYLFSKGSLLDSSATPRGNYGLQAGKGSANFGARLVMQAGSEGSVISGFSASDYLFIRTSNITVKRNFDIIVYLDNYNISDLTIEGNYRLYVQGNDNDANVYNNILIRNNFIYQFLLPLKKYTGVIINNTWAYDRTGANNGGPVSMSYFDGNSCCQANSRILLRGGNWLFKDNLIVFNHNNNTSHFQIIDGQNTTFTNNVRLSSSNEIAWPGTGDGNVNVPAAQVADIFEAFPAIAEASADGRYRLKPNSPAKAGSALRPNATIDAGMYGGPNPYKLSTIPSIPTIYSISSPQGNTPTGNTIQVNISTRSNN